MSGAILETNVDQQKFVMLDRTKRIYGDTLFSHGDEVLIQQRAISFAAYPQRKVNFDQIVEKVDFRRSSSIFVYAEVQLIPHPRSYPLRPTDAGSKGLPGHERQCGICTRHAKEVLEQALMQKALAQCYPT